MDKVENKIVIEDEASENIKFIEGAIEFKYRGNTYTIQRPSALASVAQQKELKGFDKDDLEAQVKFYIKVLIEQGLNKEVTENLDMFMLASVFTALNMPSSKKK